MKNKILLLMLLVLAGKSFARVPLTSPLNFKIGLYTAFDAASGYEQIYYRGPFAKTIQLTSSSSTKTAPQWGPKGIAFEIDGEVLTCSLFYYLEEITVNQNKLSLGCLDINTSIVYEGNPISGLSDALYNVDEYYVALGSDLNYEFDGISHDAYPVVAYNGDEEIIILHDANAYLESVNDYVAYYAGTLSSTGEVTSVVDDTITWNGTIKCLECLNRLDPNSPGDSTPDDSEDSGDEELNSDDTVVVQDVDVSQTSDQTTTVESSTVSSASTIDNSSQESQTDVVVNVNVNITNDNSSESNSSSDFSGSISSSSDSSSSADEATTTEPAEEAPEPSTDVSEDVASEPLTGASYSMEGGGGCSLSGRGATGAPLVALALILLIFLRRGAHERCV